MQEVVRDSSIPGSGDRPVSSRAKRGDLAVGERLPRTLRVLAMTLEMKRPTPYRWIREGRKVGKRQKRM
jgi:hypothetical protein